MTWDELCEKAVDLGFTLVEDEPFGGWTNRYLEKDDIIIFDNGKIEITSEDRLYNLMYQIMKALQ